VVGEDKAMSVAGDLARNSSSAMPRFAYLGKTPKAIF
jgi:hypothetical protein